MIVWFCCGQTEPNFQKLCPGLLVLDFIIIIAAQALHLGFAPLWPQWHFLVISSWTETTVSRFLFKTSSSCSLLAIASFNLLFSSNAALWAILYPPILKVNNLVYTSPIAMKISLKVYLDILTTTSLRKKFQEIWTWTWRPSFSTTLSSRSQKIAARAGQRTRLHWFIHDPGNFVSS